MKANSTFALICFGLSIIIQPAYAQIPAPKSIDIITSNPSEGQVQVSVLTSIYVKVGQDVNLMPKSDLASLYEIVDSKSSIPTAGITTYDASSQTITFKPSKPLNYGKQYELRILEKEIKIPATISFETYLNPIVKKDYLSTNFNQKEKLKYDKEGRLIEVVTLRSKNFKQKFIIDAISSYEYNKQGQQTRVTHFAKKGADGTWRTSDDVIDSYHTSIYNNDGKIIKSVSGYGPGADKEWFTDDDEAQNYFAYRYDKWGNVIQEAVYLNTGADQLILTDDDPLTYYQTYNYDASGNLIQSVRYSNAGKDSKWFTPDDNIATYTKASPINPGIVSYGAGNDQNWFTPDDIILGYRVSREAMQDFSYIYGGNAGLDGQWFTEDDALSHYTLYRKDEAGKRILFVNYTAPGIDGKWRTADDTPTTYSTYSYNNAGLLEKSIQYSGPGSDNKWFDKNDIIENYELYFVDGAGNRIKQTRYRGPGRDDKWFTKDDELEYSFFYDTKI